MAYALEPHRRVAGEVRRLAEKQLERALEKLRASGSTPVTPESVHQARRHVKKARALIRLVQPTLDHAARHDDRRLRKVSHRLSAVSDIEAVCDSVAGLASRRDAGECGAALAHLGEFLARRQHKIGRRARADGDLRAAIDLLERQLRLVPRWTFHANGFRAVEPGLGRRVDAARRAFLAATSVPSAEHYHRWRRRVKEHWLALRLLDRRCGGALADDCKRLEALDGCLGEYHNTVLLQAILRGDTVLTRQDTSRVLRLLRRCQRELRREAEQRGGELYGPQRPAQLLARAKAGWYATTRDAARIARSPGPWPDAA